MGSAPEGTFQVNIITVVRRNIRSALARANNFLAAACSWPIACTIIFLRPIIHIRIAPLYSSRIGHFTQHYEVYLCDRDRQRADGVRLPVDVFYPEEKICNRFIFKKWKQLLKVVPFPALGPKCEAALECLPSGRNHILNSSRHNDLAVTWAQWSIDTHGLLTDTEPHIRFDAAEVAYGDQSLESLGLKAGQQYVCFFNRDSAYLDKVAPERNWAYHNFRNCDIETFLPAMRWVRDQGYCAIRVGSLPEHALDVDEPGIIDYSLHDLQSDFMDVYLAAGCHFFVGCNSGACDLAHIFRRPIVWTNGAGLDIIPNLGARDVVVPKAISDAATGKTLSLSEICRRGVMSVSNGSTLSDSGVVLIDNSPDLIMAAVQEMWRIVAGTGVDPELEALHHCAIASLEEVFERRIKCRISTAFLAASPNWLD